MWCGNTLHSKAYQPRCALECMGCWYSWEHGALARHSHRFEPGTVHHSFSVCSAVWSAFLIWNQEVAGSNPATQTNQSTVGLGPGSARTPKRRFDSVQYGYLGSTPKTVGFLMS
jgi:hypothetical protein